MSEKDNLNVNPDTGANLNTENHDINEILKNFDQTRERSVDRRSEAVQRTAQKAKEKPAENVK